ncbi:MAG: helix-turn-helix domain-containing protein [Clostridia bacterium]
MLKYICLRLKEVRIEKGLTQKELAKATGFSIYQIRRWENCISSPKFFHILHLSNYLDVQIDYLTGKSDIKEMFRYETNPRFEELCGYITFD